MLGFLAFQLMAGRRAVALRNLELVFGERLSLRARRRIARGSFVGLGRLLSDFSRMPRLDTSWVARNIQIEGEEHLDRARASGRGILQVGAHYGSWELLPHVLALRGQPMSFVVRPADNEWVEGRIRSLREQSGNRVISKKDALRECLQRLRAGETVGMLIDQHVPPQHGVPVSFLGRATHALGAPAALALRTGAALLPMCIRRVRGQHHRILIGPEIEPVRSGDRRHDIAETTARIHGAIGSWIEQEPAPWLWLHRRFRDDN